MEVVTTVALIGVASVLIGFAIFDPSPLTIGCAVAAGLCALYAMLRGLSGGQR